MFNITPLVKEVLSLIMFKTTLLIR